MATILNKLKKIVGAVSPLLGGALGGPLGGLAGSMIQEALGVDSEDAAIKILESDPDSLLKLREVENTFAARMRELDIEESALNVGDVKDARLLGRERGVFFQSILTIVFMLSYFTLIYFFFTGKVNTATLGEWSKGQAGLLLGILTAAVPQILGFWFGSSEGSKRKTALMNGAKT